MKEGYTSITSDDIFSVNPFDSEGNIRKWNALKRVVTLKKTLGETHNLRNLIKEHFQEKHFERLYKSDKEVIAVVSNLTDKRPEFKSSNDNKYEDFVDWLWASCNAPIVTSIVEKDFIFANTDLTSYNKIQLFCADLLKVLISSAL